MNTKRAIVSVIVLLTILTACSGTDATASPEPSTNNTVDAFTLDIFDTTFQDALPETNQLILGTLRLDESQVAITVDQAQQLLPLWQDLRTKMSGNTSASEEILASYKQIANAMTADQINAIRDMQLTQADLIEWMQANGVAPRGPGGGGGFAPRGTISPEAQATFQAGGGPQGGPAGPRGPLSPELRATLQAGGEIPPELQATLRASGFGGPGGFDAGSGFGGRASFGLVDQLIEMLTTLANS